MKWTFVRYDDDWGWDPPILYITDHPYEWFRDWWYRLYLAMRKRK